MAFSFKHYDTQKLIAAILLLAVTIDFLLICLVDLLNATEFNLSTIVRAPTNATIIATLFYFYDRYLWKLPMLHLLVKVPNINGRYEGYIEYKWNGKVERKNCVFEVIQTASSVTVNTYHESPDHENTTSSSIAGEMVHENRQYTLYFFYTNEGASTDERLDAHMGANYLKIILTESNKPKKLVGKYFTNRNPQTKGNIDVEYKTLKLKHEF